MARSNLGRVPPVPIAEGIKNLAVPYCLDRAQALIGQHLVNSDLPLLGRIIPMEEDDIRVPFDDLFDRHHGPG